MNRKARRRAIWLLERRRLLRGPGAPADFAVPLDPRAARAVVARSWLRAAARSERQGDGDGYGD